MLQSGSQGTTSTETSCTNSSQSGSSSSEDSSRSSGDSSSTEQHGAILDTTSHSKADPPHTGNLPVNLHISTYLKYCLRHFDDWTNRSLYTDSITEYTAVDCVQNSLVWSREVDHLVGGIVHRNENDTDMTFPIPTASNGMVTVPLLVILLLTSSTEPGSNSSMMMNSNTIILHRT